MNARDDLADLIGDTWNAMPSPADHVWHILADGILAAGWRPPARTIDTAEELDALPIGAVIRDGEGEVFEQWATGDWQAVGSLDTGESRLPSEAVFPVTVLHEGARDE